MKNTIKRGAAVLSVTCLVAGSTVGSYAAPIVRRPSPSGSTVPAVEQKVDKKELTVDAAIKSATYYNLNLKRFELTREGLLREINNNYSRDKSIFLARDWQQTSLPAPGTAEYEAAKKQMEQGFNKAMASSDTVMARLVSQRGSIDMSTVMEREGIGLSIKRLFASIQQKEKDIDILKQKVAQDGKNMVLAQKMFDLGRISQSKLKEQTLEASKNANNLKIQQGKLDNYYAELENVTQISNIQQNYNLQKLAFEYKPIEFSEATQKAQQNRAADYSSTVASKKADTKIKASIYENYPNVSGESTYWQVSDEKNLSELEQSQAVRDAKQNAQRKYNSIIELQENIILAEKDITKLENQNKDLSAKFKLGMVSQNNIDNAGFALLEAKNGLESQKLQHFQLVQMYENPYFAGMAG